MITITVRCDGRTCCNEREFYENDPYETTILDSGWTIDVLNESHYCPTCKKKMIANGELEDDED